MSDPPRPRASETIATAFRALVRPPFRVLVSLGVLISLTSTTFSEEPTGTETLLSIVLLVAAVYLQIAVILAAGSDTPDASADVWIRGAVRRRCFWRFLITSLLVVLGLLAGVLLLVIGVFLVGALLGFAQTAAVLERRVPLDATARSARLAKDHRVVVGIVFALLILVPTGVVQSIPFLGWADPMEPWWLATLTLAEVLTAAGTIALTRLFVAVGGAKTPSMDRLAPARPGSGGRPG